ncbi:hypothetical protein CYMTET_15326 [Cymbomonas tetramitiformis]|uniref:Uncharacterized protein n=1 Tax=Cymbomonas tetramitiformis TaxID=36881 RepID=A0AAE0GES4_9CHLO|nr:hypothetical protein CYMTET_15326 [Cymbomonas tetramitiformis]
MPREGYRYLHEHSSSSFSTRSAYKPGFVCLLLTAGIFNYHATTRLPLFAPPFREQEAFLVPSATSPSPSGINPTTESLSRNFAQIDLTQDPEGVDFADLWNGENLFSYDDGSSIPSQTKLSCKALFLAASSITGKGVVVEFNPWFGHSSRCIGAGLNTSGFVHRLYSYETFRAAVSKEKLKGTRYEHDPSAVKYYRAIWEQTVRPVYPSARAIEGPISKKLSSGDWHKDLVEMLVLKSVRTPGQFFEQVPHVWGHLGIGSIICFMDFAKTFQMELIYAQFVRTGILEALYLDFCASPWIFVARKPLPWERIRNFLPRKYSKDQWRGMFQLVNDDVTRIAEKYRVQSEEKIDCVRHMVSARENRINAVLAGSAIWLDDH